MQKAELVLVKLNQKSNANSEFKFQRLYRNLFNQDFYLHAYSKIYSKEGNMTPGSDGKTIDGFSTNWITELITLIREEKYYPTPVKRVYIPKKNGKKRPLGIPTFKDKLVQEIIREILEAIYEPLFSNNSHGFRPKRSCHTALLQIKRSCIGSSWAIEGDIQSYFDTISHEVLIQTLKQKIEDGRFIELIRRFLKAGYIKEGITYNSITGTPQGGIISPILANIYLNEMDKYMEILINKYTIGIKKKANPEYEKLRRKKELKRQQGNIKEVKELIKQIRKLPSKAPIDTDFIRIKYVRYADDFVIFINGSRFSAEKIKNEIAKYLKEKLKLKLNKEKTLITNLLKSKAQFLGYEICKSKNDTRITKDAIGRKKRDINGLMQLKIPYQVINKKIKDFTQNGKIVHRKDRINFSIMRIIMKYNDEIRGLYNYYCMALNVSKVMNKFKYYHYGSLLKTVGRKEKSSVKKVLKKYGISVSRKIGTGTKKIFGVKYHTKQGDKIATYFNKSLRRIDNPIYPFNNFNKQIEPEWKTCELLTRFNKNECELCKNHVEAEKIVVHHIRKLNEIDTLYRNSKTLEWIQLMKKMRRKTLILCMDCHNKIHHRI